MEKDSMQEIIRKLDYARDNLADVLIELPNYELVDKIAFLRDRIEEVMIQIKLGKKPELKENKDDKKTG